MIKNYLQKKETKFTISVVLFLLINTLHGQVVNYPFEGNINDVVNSVSGTYIQYQNGGATANYVSTPSGGQGLDLAHNQYVALDDNFKTLITSGDSFEIEIDFRYTYTGMGNGRKPIFGSKPTGNASSGLVLNALGIDDTTFNMHLGIADGNFDESLFFKVNPSPLNTNEEIKIILKIDYQERTWFFKANDVYNFGFLSDGFNIDAFKNALQNIPAYVGWQANHGPDMEFHNLEGTMIIDHFQLHVPARPGDASVLSSALQQMTDHILGNITLTQAQRDEYTTAIIINHQKNYINSKVEIDNYLAAFEANRDPLFVNRVLNPALSSLPNEDRIAYFLMQDIFDNEFVAGNMANIAGMSFREGDIYPGPVSNSAPRVNNTLVAINATYRNDPGIQLVEGHRGVLRPTGYYAAPGELVTVTVPSNMVNQGVEIVAGAHIRESNINGMQRFQRISKSIDVTSTTTQIANPFGGALYFRIPQGMNENLQTVTIDGAVKSPYFRMVSGQPQNLNEWITDLNNDYVKWVDIESDTMMFTLPTSMIGSMDITAVMLKWNEMMDFIHMIAGRPSDPIRAEYVQVDCTGGVGSAGYPKLMHENTYDQIPPSRYWSPLRVLEGDFVETNQGFIFHELGHNMLYPIPTGHAETVVQLYSIPAYYLLTNDIERSIRNVEDETFGRDGGAIAWMITPEFRNNSEMLDEHAKYQVRGGLKWVDIATLFSWEDVGEIHKFFYDKWTIEGGSPLGNTHVTYSEYLKAATERTDVNMTPLLNFWGMIPTSGEISTYDNYSQSCEIYDRLLYYRSLVPLTQSDFLPWRDLLLDQVDPYHHAEINDIYANYDSQNIGNQIISQIDYLITTYYPNAACQSFQNDISLRAINSPNASQMNCGDVLPQIRVRNNGMNDIAEITITYGVDGGTTYNYSWNGMLQSNEETNINLPSFSTGTGNFTLNVAIAIANDENSSNNNSTQNFSASTSGTFNEINSFENPSDELIVQNTVWERGVPSGSTLNNSATGTQVYGTNLSGNYPANTNASLQSNCYDFTQIIDPILKFKMAYDIEENWDWANVEYSLDGGQSWNILGNINSQPNWYNSDRVEDFDCIGCPGAQWTGTNAIMTQFAYDFSQNAALGEADLTEATNITFRMTLHSDDIIHQEGIVIDDFVVEGKDPIVLNPKIVLQGAALNPKVGEENLMRDDLRVANIIPTQSPYGDASFCKVEVFDIEGVNAIVDWVWVELRDANNSTIVVASQSALLQRDGDVVGVDGVSPISFVLPEGAYYVAIKHRNHLGVITASTVTISSTGTVIDFTDANNQITFGTDAQTTFGMPNGNVVAMWAGDASGNGQIRFLGPGNDLNNLKGYIINDPGNTSGSASYPVSGYSNADLNLNGQARFLGPGNDNNILKNIILSNPENTNGSTSFPITQQLP